MKTIIPILILDGVMQNNDIYTCNYGLAESDFILASKIDKIIND